MKNFTNLFLLMALPFVPNTFSQTTTAPDAPGDIAKRDAAFKKMPNHPLAPEEFRKPEGYKLVSYPMSLEEISKKYSAQTIAKGKTEYARVSKINRDGKWKPTPQSIDSHKCPEWFEDAKLGVFIDWGLWSIASWAPARDKGAMYPDWYELRMYSDFTPESHFWGYRSYHIKNWGADFQRDHFIPLFRGEKFDAKKLVKLFADMGAKYVVPFNKHHSGFCIWDCSYTFRDTADSEAKRDFVAEIVKQCAAQKLKFGFYFSLTEWEYPVIGDDGKLANFSWGKLKPYSADMEYKSSRKIAVKDYVKEYMIPQAVEFIDRYSPDILWFDGEWGVSATELGSYDLSAYFYNVNEGKKEVAVNDRFGEGTAKEIEGRFTKRPRKWLRTIRGDFFTDEYGDTSECINPENHHAWEACRGISQSFGNNWQDDASNVQSANEFISSFVDIVARGGNLLLLVNLDGQGAIPEIQRERLLDIGKWLKKYGEAIYSTRIVAPYATSEVAYTRSKDGKLRYAIIKNPKSENVLEVSPDSVEKVEDISTGEKLKFSKSGEGKILVSLPTCAQKNGLPVAVRITLK